MTQITFAKPPLVEIIAELRWIPQGSTVLEPPVPQQPALPPLFFGGTKQEEFYMRVGGELYKSNFNRSERLIPAGIPFVLHQPVYRFRSEVKDKVSVLYQVGYGVFSVHGIPPYHSWSTFLAFVRDGIQVLLESRPEADSRQPFSQLILRYIDFFGEEMRQGRDISRFMSEVFGISTQLPAALTKPATSKEPKSLLTRVVLPIEIGELTVSVADGKFNNQDGILLDSTASCAAETAAELDTVMNVFGAAYELIHNMFLELTEPIHELMQPQREKSK
jgi:uncharacterized protein (TIGR04255 family)